ncbi:hypothetical protein V6N12_046394 [Hibiscus sabdariffa]|uniref:Uncharacterized protein n=1 Tax=Hibiscus sabdariffa TaxID=183260 RepID=A0ABR2DII3_9ROSI
MNVDGAMNCDGSAGGIDGVLGEGYCTFSPQSALAHVLLRRFLQSSSGWMFSWIRSGRLMFRHVPRICNIEVDELGKYGIGWVLDRPSDYGGLLLLIYVERSRDVEDRIENLGGSNDELEIR